MAIEGPLHELALSDVLQLLGMSRKTGVLRVWRENSASPVLVYLEQGAVVGVRAPQLTRDLGELLLLAEALNPAQLESALETQRSTPGKLLGELLLEQGLVTAEEVERQLRFQIEEVMFALLLWRKGHFRFQEERVPLPELLPVRMTTESLLLEAMRRQDEWTELADVAPDTELVPHLFEEAPHGAMLDLDPLEWEVLAAVDGERTLRQIARDMGQAEFEVAKAVFSLVSAGVVEVKHVHGGEAAPDTVPAGLDEVERALHEQRLNDAEALLEPLLAEYPDHSEVQLLRGRLAAARREWGSAMAWLERAVQLDPLLAPGYYHLGEAAARAGDWERAEEALDTFMRLPEAAPQREAAARAVRALGELRKVFREDRA